MKYNIVYKCGHIGKIDLYGKMESRQNYIEWAKDNKVCPECKIKAEKEIKEKIENKVKNMYTLPHLEGTEKQIKWADDIRLDALVRWQKKVDEKIEEVATKVPYDALEEEVNKIKIKINTLLSGAVDAKWWIDNRNIDNIIDMLVLKK